MLGLQVMSLVLEVGDKDYKKTIVGTSLSLPLSAFCLPRCDCSTMLSVPGGLKPLEL